MQCEPLIQMLDKIGKEGNEIMINYKETPFYLKDEEISWVEETLQNMSTKEKIEQLFCPLAFMTQPEALKGMLSQHKFGGLMFRSGNAEELQEAFRAAQEVSEIPMFISANLEDGGNGIAATEGTYMGRQMLIAATGDTEKAYQLGKICAREGNAVGVNWAFSPVVDIDKNFRNPITNVRTYGSNPDKVLAMGEAYMKGVTEEGMIVSIKHFPGDGVDERDQHLLTSVNSLAIEEWEASYGKIYRELIKKGAQTVMVGHIAMPAMEEYYDKETCRQVIPASQSKNVLRYLREELGFNGLISTDASPMVGFTCARDRRTAVPLAIENGCDVFLFNKDMEEDIVFMQEGYENGILSEARLNEAVARILATKAAMGVVAKKAAGTLSPSKEELKVLQCEEHVTWAKECADMGITLVKDTKNILPLDVKKHKRVLLEIIGDFASNERVQEHFVRLLEKEGFDITLYEPETPENIFNDGEVMKFKSKYDLVLYIGNIENASNKTVARINWHTLFGAGNNLPWFAAEVPTVFVSVGNPYHLFDVPMVPTYINGYCHSPYVIEAMVEKLMGRSEFKGISPVDPFCGTFGTDL